MGVELRPFMLESLVMAVSNPVAMDLQRVFLLQIPTLLFALAVVGIGYWLSNLKFMESYKHPIHTAEIVVLTVFLLAYVPEDLAWAAVSDAGREAAVDVIKLLVCVMTIHGGGTGNTGGHRG